MFNRTVDFHTNLTHLLQQYMNTVFIPFATGPDAVEVPSFYNYKKHCDQHRGSAMNLL